MMAYYPWHQTRIHPGGRPELNAVWGTKFGNGPAVNDMSKIQRVFVDENDDFCHFKLTSSSGLPTTAGASGNAWSGKSDAFYRPN